MRKIVSVVLLAMGAMSLQAQLFVRPEAGMTTNQTHGSDVWNAGWKAGAGVEYRFKRNSVFSLQSGAYYQTETGKYDASVGLATQDYKLYITSGSYQRRSLSVPLQAKFSWKLSDQVRMYAAVGPNFNIRFKGKMKNYSDEIDYTLADGATVVHYPSGSYAYYYISKQDEQGNPYDEMHEAMISQKRTVRNTPYDETGVELTAAFNVGLEFNRLSINVNYEAHPGRIRKYAGSYGYGGNGYSTSYYEDKWGIGWHQIGLTIGYTFRLTK